MLAMPFSLAIACILFTTTAPCAVSALDNGQAATPMMGYNTWNCFATDIDEATIRSTADAMVDLGLMELGYSYLNLDDAWSEQERTQQGLLKSNTPRFPSGIASLSDYIHTKGMKFGIYGDAGELTCAGYPGSRGHEVDDATTWAQWGVDYLKYDNCYASDDDDVVERYRAMRDAINATGRHMVFSLCEWGVQAPWLWAPDMGNSWRTSDDINPTWDRILANLENSIGLSRFAGPGAWNDPDLLEVGNGQLSLGEQRSHFVLWAILKAPLLISADLRSISPDSLAILKAREVIAINQDPLGVPGDRVWKQGAREIFAGPLEGGARAVVMFNRHNIEYCTTLITVHWQEIGLPVDCEVAVRDVLLEEDLGSAQGSFTAAVGVHDVRALRITPLEGCASLALDLWRPWDDQPMYAAHEGDNENNKVQQQQLAMRGPTDLV